MQPPALKPPLPAHPTAAALWPLPSAGASVVATLSPMLAAQQELAALADKRDPNILVLLLGQKFRWGTSWVAAPGH